MVTGSRPPKLATSPGSLQSSAPQNRTQPGIRERTATQRGQTLKLQHQEKEPGSGITLPLPMFT